MNSSRRSFLKASGACTMGFLGLRSLTGDGLSRPAPTPNAPAGYGDLQPDPEGVIELPAGFTYRTLSQVGELMDDGYRVPGLHDGMAAFPGPAGSTILVRNHELGIDHQTIGAFGPINQLLKTADREKLYDAGRKRRPCLGGTTNVVYNTREMRLEKHFLSLGGTVRNCAGGLTPWGSWITCEETVQKEEGLYAREHGYNFEVPASSEVGLTPAVPLKAMGRFVHEAVAVDPKSGIVYETEDRGDGLLYRFIPDKPGELAAGGRLQVLKVKGKPGLDTRNWNARKVLPGHVFEVEWAEIDDVESPNDDLRYRGFEDLGAARFARGEGMWWDKGWIYFVCTNGGLNKKGQVWRYAPSSEEGKAGEKNRPGKLELFIEPNDGNLVENADNLTVAPWGDLILCEDGPEEQFVVGVTPRGDLYKLGRNVFNNSEFAGSTFSPDGTTLFVNIQNPGITLAIKGPWQGKRS